MPSQRPVVPLHQVHIATSAAVELKELHASRVEGFIHMTADATNPWAEMFGGVAWFGLIRVGAPIGHFCVAFLCWHSAW